MTADKHGGEKKITHGALDSGKMAADEYGRTVFAKCSRLAEEASREKEKPIRASGE